MGAQSNVLQEQSKLSKGPSILWRFLTGLAQAVDFQQMARGSKTVLFLDHSFQTRGGTFFKFLNLIALQADGVMMRLVVSGVKGLGFADVKGTHQTHACEESQISVGGRQIDSAMVPTGLFHDLGWI